MAALPADHLFLRLIFLRRVKRVPSFFGNASHHRPVPLRPQCLREAETTVRARWSYPLMFAVRSVVEDAKAVLAGGEASVIEPGSV